MKFLKRFLPYLSDSKGKIVALLLSALVSTGSKLAIPFLAGKAVNALIKDAHADLSLYLILMAALLVTGVIFRYVFDFLTQLVGQKAVKRMRKEVFAAYDDAPISYLDSHAHGDLMSRIGSDVENVQNGLISGLATLFDGVAAILITLAFMFFLNWALALIVVGLTPISIFVSRFVSKYNVKHFSASAKANGEMNSFVLESLRNGEAVETLGIKKDRMEEFKEKNEAYRNHIFKANLGSSIINPTTRLVNATINAILIIVGSAFIISMGDTALWPLFLVGDLCAFLTYAANYTAPFNEVSNVIAEIDSAVASFHRIDEAVHAPKDIDEGKGDLEGEIRSFSAEDVAFSYDGTRKIFEDVDFSIEKGKRFALVGPTGCGKTTIINLLLRFYDPQQGMIRLNDVDIASLSKAALRARIGMVLQDTWIARGTIHENIAYGKPDASRAEVIAAAKKAQAHHFIETLPHGYDEVIDEDTGLSQGQRQLLCVARVLLIEPEIIILDEATSNIDVRTEALLGESFASLMEGRTSLVVAHRLSTIVSSDCILVLKDGRIIERGKHEELLKKKGFYASLYQAQFE